MVDLLKTIYWLGVIAFTVMTLSMTITGVVLGFKSSIVIGILLLMVAPAAAVTGYLWAFSDVNLAEMLTAFINAHTVKPIP